MDDPSQSVSAFDCDILCSTFIKAVIEKNIPKDQWRAHAALLIREFTGSDDVDPDLVERIAREYRP